VLWLQPARALRSAHLLPRLRLLQQLKAALLPALPGLLGVPAAGATVATPGLCVPQLRVLVQPPAAPAAGAAPDWAAQHPLPALLKRCRVLQSDEGGARALCTLPPDAQLLVALPEAAGSASQEGLVAAALAALLPPAAPQPAQPAGVQPASAAAAVAAALAPQRAAVAAAASAVGLAQWRDAVSTLAQVLEAAAAAPSQPPGADAQRAAGPAAVPPEAAAAAAWQAACCRAAWDFSHASSKRAAAVAADAYRRNTPPLLPAAGHAVALQAALRLYASLARGPAAAEGAAQLRRQLDAYWRDGRRQCDAVSLLGALRPPPRRCCRHAGAAPERKASALLGG
jgi:hypothetical protein